MYVSESQYSNRYHPIQEINVVVDKWQNEASPLREVTLKSSSNNCKCREQIYKRIKAYQLIYQAHCFVSPMMMHKYSIVEKMKMNNKQNKQTQFFPR